jgi:malate dehydrogenase (oxaloacetate-decarboxylating)(NADP+)
MNAPTKMTTKLLSGYDRLHNARLNKGTAFTKAESSAFGLEGLLPPAVLSLELQVAPLGPIACATTNGTSGLVGYHPG